MSYVFSWHSCNGKVPKIVLTHFVFNFMYQLLTLWMINPHTLTEIIPHDLYFHVL